MYFIVKNKLFFHYRLVSFVCLITQFGNVKLEKVHLRKLGNWGSIIYTFLESK